MEYIRKRTRYHQPHKTEVKKFAINIRKNQIVLKLERKKEARLVHRKPIFLSAPRVFKIFPRWSMISQFGGKYISHHQRTNTVAFILWLNNEFNMQIVISQFLIYLHLHVFSCSINGTQYRIIILLQLLLAGFLENGTNFILWYSMF